MMTLTDQKWFQDSDTALVLFFNFFNIHLFTEAVLEVPKNLLCSTVVLMLNKTVTVFTRV